MGPELSNWMAGRILKMILLAAFVMLMFGISIGLVIAWVAS